MKSVVNGFILLSMIFGFASCVFATEQVSCIGLNCVKKFNCGDDPFKKSQATAPASLSECLLHQGWDFDPKDVEKNPSAYQDKIKTNFKSKVFNLEDLKAGGVILVFRHTERSVDKINPKDEAPLDNKMACIEGLTLNETGKKNAQIIANGMKKLGIKFESVIASPTCRTREMAKIIMGSENYKTDRALVYSLMRSDDEYISVSKNLRKIVSTPVPAGQVRVLLSHSIVLHTLGMNTLEDPEIKKIDQGDAIVIRSLGNQNFELMGFIRIKKWQEI